MSRGEEAARWLAEHGGSCRAAGEQFGVSREAVRQWWRRLYGEVRLPSLAVGDQIAELARSGKTAREIATTLEVTWASVYTLCRNRGITLTREAQKPWAAAITAVKAGAALIDAAVDHGVSEGGLTEKCLEAGVRSQVRGGTSERMDGRLKRAARRVLEGGMTQAEASRAERCARSGVSITLRKIREQAAQGSGGMSDDKHEIPVAGAKVYVPGEKRGYVVRARNDRFAVCTKPHFGTVRYFILDAITGIRGPENLVFGMGAETNEQCVNMLRRVTDGETEVTYRNRVPWDIERVVLPIANQIHSPTP